MQNYFRSVVLFSVVLSATAWQSCSTAKPLSETEVSTKTTNPKKVKLNKPITTIDLRILNSDEVTVLPNDFSTIIDLLEKANYDKKWNKTGMMVKMKTPDYSLNLISDKSVSTTVFIWTEGNRVKMDDAWYLLNANNTAQLSAFLEKYKNAFNN
ncbi:hypothetical protein [Flavobacterium sp. NKUCC04_CG]|uniref:hypothetical protein n=1 Tax=Flavobacterium sp. NKUCC04_CG TaxID=2842121 RepID=UPI001C5B6020|nr:hypothetical protein [Flavobacterium sp. NKUCC04_CG]MBW3519648.1 hypothetical protein [Flavobacterium sp. NKUCC04_CG]